MSEMKLDIIGSAGALPMSTLITFKPMGGIGVNAKYTVMRDGAPVAVITRNGNRGWLAYSGHYGVTLFRGRTIDDIKRTALDFDYPSRQQIYETLAQETAIRRRNYIEGQRGHDFVRLTREMIAGSNSARIELEKLISEIDAWIADRSDTMAERHRQNEAHFQKTGKRIYTDSGIPLYPDQDER